MEKNNQYDEQLIKYLANEVDLEEKEFIENWLNASMENREYFESLKHAWQLTAAKKTLDYVLNEMNVDEKWNQFKQTITAKETAEVSIHALETFDGEKAGAQNPKRKSVVRRLLVSTAIAASVILVIVLGVLFFTKNKTNEQPVAENSMKRNDSTRSFVHHEVNTTGQEKRIQLPDGSLVVLTDKSEITYREPFTDKRDITLIGKAYFKVAKDKTKPFTVTSGAISTTALGTEFTVTAFKNTNQIIVRLYEGKVVVKAVDKINQRMKKDVYLLPGQQFIYGNQSTEKVMSFKATSVAPEQIMNDESTNDNPSIPENAEAPYFMFNNQSLNQVLDDLGALYNVEIIYNKKDIQNIYFTAKYNRSESLETILKRIGILNNLTVTKKENAFVISK